MELLPQTGILAMMVNATLTVKFVLGVLVLMSVTSWSMILFKFFSLTTARKTAAEDLIAFQGAKSLDDGMRLLAAHRSSPLYRAGTMAVNELRRLDESGLLHTASMKVVMGNLDRALKQGVGAQLKELTRSLAFLATCGNSAPFIGLFGTVWGIMHAFHSIAQMKTAALAAVAPGISEALIATAIGLLVAIPATIFYNYFLGKLNEVESGMIDFAGAFLNRAEREITWASKGEKN